MLPKVGLIYLTYPTQNWERDIPRFMASLENIDYPKDRIELICVESKSKLEPVKDWFEKNYGKKSGRELPRISYIFNDAWIGFAGNNNLGVDKARELGCDYVHLTNEDTDIEPDYIRRAVERAELDPKVAIVQSLLLLGKERDKVNSVGNDFHFLGFGYSKGYGWSFEQAKAYFERRQRWDPEFEINYPSGAGMLVRMSAIEQMGQLFDDRFFWYHEDTDSGLMARCLGFKVVVEPSSIIYHYYEFAKSKQIYFWMERNRYALIFSYYKFWTLFVLAPMLCIMDVALLVFSIKSGWLREKLDVYREWLRPGYWKWIRERRKRIFEKRVIQDVGLLRLAVSEIAYQGEGVKNPILEKIGNPLMRWYWYIMKRFI